VEINPEQAQAFNNRADCLLHEGRTFSSTFENEAEKSTKYESSEKEHGNLGS